MEKSRLRNGYPKEVHCTTSITTIIRDQIPACATDNLLGLVLQRNGYIVGHNEADV